MNINMTHCLLGHRNDDSVRKTAKVMVLMLTRGTLRSCKHCAKIQKHLRKELVANKATILRHCLYLDLSKVYEVQYF